MTYGSTTLPVHFRGEVAHRADASALLSEPADLVIVKRGRPRLAIIKCPSGCGDEVVVNLDSRAGPSWYFYKRVQGISLYPSVWRDVGCGAHFVIWRGKCLLFGADERDWYSDDPATSKFSETVLAQFVGEDERHFEDIAKQLDEVPWTISSICVRLVREGMLTTGSRLGFYKRASGETK